MGKTEYNEDMMKNNFNFFDPERLGGIVLILVTAVSLFLSNSSASVSYISFWDKPMGGHTLVHWINDGLMTLFFLLVGLELKREVNGGELSSFRKSLLPAGAALGGMVVPAAFYMLFNLGTPYQRGAGIPMATDIAFALGILSLLGNRVPKQLKVFLTTLAVVDDLGAIIIIAVFYTEHLLWINVGLCLLVLTALAFANRKSVSNVWIYLGGGIVVWVLLLYSGLHATLAGVLLAAVIPDKGPDSTLIRLEHALKLPVAFFVVPLFAMANTAIELGNDWLTSVTEPVSIGIIAGLVIGKPVGIILGCVLVVVTGMARLPESISFKKITGAGFLGGIGFTMSVFISLLAFDDPDIIRNSKFSVLIASVISALTGFLWLSFFALRATRISENSI